MGVTEEDYIMWFGSLLLVLFYVVYGIFFVKEEEEEEQGGLEGGSYGFIDSAMFQDME